MNEDFSDILEKFNINKDSISPEMINNIMEMLNHSSDNEESSTNNDTTSSDFNMDFETILKIKSIFEQINKKDDPRSKLLLSLRPYLKNSRQNKLDQYIQLSKLLQLLPLINGDNNAKK